MSQSLVSNKVHVVFSTKDRSPWISADYQDRLYAYIGTIAADRGSVLLAAGGMPDHVHLLVGLHPSVALSDLVRDIKANSSRFVHERFPEVRGFAWQSGYAAFSVSESAIPDVRSYIANQAEHHRTRSFQEELVAFLQKHGVAFDPQFIWR